MVEPQLGGSYERLLALARWAEDIGLDSFARSDHYLHFGTSSPATDALTTFGGLARETERIQLVVLVTPITFRHPAVIAKTAATIDEMSGGRLGLGIGTGWMEPEHEAFGMDLPDLTERFDRFAETLAYVRAATSGSGGFRGTHYELRPIDVLPRPEALPIIVGGSGMRRTPTLAGRFADEYNIFTCERELFEQRVAVMRAAPDEYVELLRAQNVPHGTPEEAAAGIERMAAMGVSKVYLQEMSALDDVDTAKLGSIVGAVRARPNPDGDPV
jgi:alkanesulfonate monooxygenase SsuD/methylene tetrahydromethanopterin reductase-like flavin-dependent oxidoreductase (luciferase family)